MSTEAVKQTQRPCRSCRAPMWWSVTHRGKRIPLDANPVDPIALGSWRGVWYYEHATNTVRPALPTDPGPFWLGHHATCPQGRAWKGASAQEKPESIVPIICPDCGHRGDAPKGTAPRCRCGGGMLELINPM